MNAPEAAHFAWFRRAEHNLLSISNNMAAANVPWHDESVWDHLAGTRSAPFEAGEQKEVAVKAIDDRGNVLLVVKELRA
jgi:hypothetical protein